MENLDWKTRLLIYLVMKRYRPSAPGWLVVAEHLWQQRSIIAYLGSSRALSSSVESSLHYILTISKSGQRTAACSVARLCYSLTRPVTIKMASITKGYVDIYKNPENALQAFREHGEEQEIQCLRPRAEWPTQANPFRG